jgi:hypothetical protein
LRRSAGLIGDRLAAVVKLRRFARQPRLQDSERPAHQVDAEIKSRRAKAGIGFFRREERLMVGLRGRLRSRRGFGWLLPGRRLGLRRRLRAWARDQTVALEAAFDGRQDRGM